MLVRLSFLILLILPVVLKAQQKKYLFFDQNWTQAATEGLKKYTCEVYTTFDGAFEGPMTCFNDETDSIVKIYNFQANQLHGNITEYFDDGSLKIQATYNYGLPIGEWKEWDSEGVLVVHKTFDESSRMLKDYFVEKTPFETEMAFSNKKEEPPIYSSSCIMKRIDKEKYLCSDFALQQYYRNPPRPPHFLTERVGSSYATLLRYEISDRGEVLQVEIVKSSGDAFLDELAEVHVLNMVPFESAKQYGNPINYWMDAEIVFGF